MTVGESARVMLAPSGLAPRGCLIIAATSAAAARRYAAANNVEPHYIVTRRELKRGPRSLREVVSRHGLRRAIVHSVDWSRQGLPQIYEIALLVAPVDERYLADDRRGTTTRVDEAAALRCVARLPWDGTAAGGCVLAESLRFSTSLLRRPNRVDRRVSESPSVMATWLGSLESPVGGSITHMSGMLAGFRELGVRVGLVTSVEPPEQLAEVVDDVEITSPLSRGARVNGDISRLAENETLRRAGRALAERLQPAFIYQRHGAFLVAGADLAHTVCIPLVLEWNASEVWCRANWEQTRRLLRVLDPLLSSMERHIVRAAARILAVSTPAAHMALEAGADPSKVFVIPNAAHTAQISELIRDVPPRAASRPLIGWIGSFGPWHGAEVLVEALAHLDEGVDLLMIGDGRERHGCERLAERLGLAHRIEWAGSLPHDEAVRRLARCDILASPHVPLPGQQFFGSPTKLFEYMAIGRPIVASNLEQLGEVLDDHRTARLVEPGDVASLTAGIAQILAMTDRGAGLGEAARREAREHHDWTHRAQAVLDRVPNLRRGSQ